MRLLLLVFLLLFSVPGAAEPLPPGPFSEADCVQCHGQETPGLVTAWQIGPHGKARPIAGCTSCHGSLHDGSAARSRQSGVCIECHGGLHDPVVRSYLTSKHGVIATIESDRYDFSKPLSDANYRAPSCAYCHNHDGAHGTSAKADDACYDCHSPRYVAALFASAKRGTDIGQLKLQEAQNAVTAWRRKKDRPDAVIEKLDAMLHAMRDGPLAGLRLGSVHASPDYQWWYGQAALDGDLVRIKAALSRLQRTDALAQ